MCYLLICRKLLSSSLDMSPLLRGIIALPNCVGESWARPGTQGEGRWWGCRTWSRTLSIALQGVSSVHKSNKTTWVPAPLGAGVKLQPPELSRPKALASRMQDAPFSTPAPTPPSFTGSNWQWLPKDLPKVSPQMVPIFSLHYSTWIILFVCSANNWRTSGYLLLYYQVYNIAVQYFYKLCSIYSYYKEWLYFPTLQNISWLLTYFIHSSFYLLISYPILPLPYFFLSTDNH